jgi:hypothetical protein
MSSRRSPERMSSRILFLPPIKTYLFVIKGSDRDKQT